MTIYVRTTLTVPGAGSVVNVAELAELNDRECRMVRMIELTPDHVIMGAFIDGKIAGQANEPLDTVPHPDTYDDFPDISAQYVDQSRFDALWSEATAKFGL